MSRSDTYLLILLAVLAVLIASEVLEFAVQAQGVGQ